MDAIVLAAGANTSIPNSGRILVAVGWAPQAVLGMEADASAFMVGANGKVPNDQHFVFYGSQSSPEGSVRFFASPARSSDMQVFEVDLEKVPAGVESIDICLTIHEGQARGQSFGTFEGVSARLVDLSSDREIARFDLQVTGRKETAITLVKVYRRNGQWKFRAIGQGFAGGLAPLARQYGVDVADETPTPPLEAVREKPDSLPQPSPPELAPPPTPVSLTKVTLEKRGQSVSLEKKRNEGFGEIVFNLNWNQRPEKKRGFLGGLLGGRKGIDLDLGCLWELEDGRKGVVQALGEAWGNYRGEPFIQHAGDDRTGASAQGENIRINGDRMPKIKRILVFAFIYDGVPNWAMADGVATVKIPDQQDIEVRLDNPTVGQGMCAIALIENERGKLKVTKEERYFPGHIEMDKAYRWGLRWMAGSKD